MLSGFLVTQLLLRDIAGRGAGSGSAGSTPAGSGGCCPPRSSTLIVTAVVFTAIASPVEVARRGRIVQGRVLVRHELVLHRTKPPATSAPTSPPTRCCTSGRLAVEEQFYLLWPLLLGGLFVGARRFGLPANCRVIRIAVAAGAIASLLWAWQLRTTNPNRAYYGTDARAYQLLAGALFALTPAVIDRRSPRTTRAARVARRRRPRRHHRHRHDLVQPRPHPTRHRRSPSSPCTVIAAIEAADRRPRHPTPVPATPRLPRQDLLRHLPVALARHRRHHPHLPPHHHRHHRPHRASSPPASPPSATRLLEHPIRLPPSSTATATPSSPPASPPASSPPSSSSPPSPTPPPPPPPPTSTTPTTGFTPVPNLDWTAIKKELGPLHNCYAKPADDCTSCTAPAHHPAHRRQPRRHARPRLHHHRPTTTTSPSPSPPKAAAPGNTTSTPFPATIENAAISTGAVQASQRRPLRPRHTRTRTPTSSSP